MMQKIQILDCTLRDGGYCNQWKFGRQNIVTIMKRLKDAQIDIIECGFLTDKITYDPEGSRFNSLEQIAAVLPEKNTDALYVCMINYGEYDVSQLKEYDGSSVDGIRVAFHKKDMEEALGICRSLKEKGYKVFVQPMVSLRYTDMEFLALVERCNELQPYAFYIVDSFGVMKRKELMRLFRALENNLEEDVIIGYHSHNNMQLAYANAQALVDTRTHRDIIIDCSVFGMGRGAGNLNTELFIEYMNDNNGTAYAIKPLLHIIDEVLNPFYERNYWGYSLPNYLSAKHNIHPNYAAYLMEKHTITVDDMNEIFSMIPDDKKVDYDLLCIDQLYTAYLGRARINEERLCEFAEKLRGKRILLIAPGKSVEEEWGNVVSFAQESDVVSIGINFEYQHYPTDYIFVSNLRRFRRMNDERKSRTIVTSNIQVDDVYITADYTKLLNDIEAVKDNAGLMLIKYLISLGVKEIYLAGMDGYSHEMGHNFAESQMEFSTNYELFDAMNRGIGEMLRKYAGEIKISYITTPKYIKLEEE